MLSEYSVKVALPCVRSQCVRSAVMTCPPLPPAQHVAHRPNQLAELSSLGLGCLGVLAGGDGPARTESAMKPTPAVFHGWFLAWVSSCARVRTADGGVLGVFHNLLPCPTGWQVAECGHAPVLDVNVLDGDALLATGFHAFQREHSALVNVHGA